MFSFIRGNSRSYFFHQEKQAWSRVQPPSSASSGLPTCLYLRWHLWWHGPSPTSPCPSLGRAWSGVHAYHDMSKHAPIIPWDHIFHLFFFWMFMTSWWRTEAAAGVYPTSCETETLPWMRSSPIQPAGLAGSRLHRPRIQTAGSEDLVPCSPAYTASALLPKPSLPPLCPFKVIN